MPKFGYKGNGYRGIVLIGSRKVWEGPWKASYQEARTDAEMKAKGSYMGGDKIVRAMARKATT